MQSKDSDIASVFTSLRADSLLILVTGLPEKKFQQRSIAFSCSYLYRIMLKFEIWKRMTAAKTDCFLASVEQELTGAKLGNVFMR